MDLQVDPLLLDAIARGLVIGVDEVGRGCIAGPISACAYIFTQPQTALPELRDSKEMRPRQREVLLPVLCSVGTYGYAEVSSKEIDRIGIQEANFKAMRRAIRALKLPDFSKYHVVVDGNQLPKFPRLGVARTWCVVKADDKIPAVSAASVIAKVYRDRAMAKFARTYPRYGFERNAGYGVKHHTQAISEVGLCPIHRRSFEPCKSIVLAGETNP